MKLDKKNIPVTWTNEWKDFDWKETFMIDEIPKEDNWDTHATRKKLELEKLYLSLGISKDCTRHFMSLRPELSPGLTKIIERFKDHSFNYNFLKLTAGYNLIKHYDTYATFVKLYNVPENKLQEISRTIVMMTEWSFGQIIQVNDQIETNWKIGDTYTWKGDIWHGVANFGFDDFVCMQVTWL